jgi:tRNA pseudouridine38-40 synthase
MTSEPKLRLRGAGRTDAGVHARAQVANFFTETRIPARGFMLGLNAKLPRDVAIRAAEEVPASFDARRSARGKIYRYSIWNQENRSPLLDRFVWHVRGNLDLGAMRQAAGHLVGEHDFRAFRASDCERRNTVRTLRRLEVSREGDLLRFEVEATAFLKNMVRILVGTLVAVGQGRLPADEVARIRDAGDRTRAGATAPPQGLELVQVFYPAPAEYGEPPSYDPEIVRERD